MLPRKKVKLTKCRSVGSGCWNWSQEAIGKPDFPHCCYATKPTNEAACGNTPKRLLTLGLCHPEIH